MNLVFDQMMAGGRQPGARLALAAMLGDMPEFDLACVGVSMRGLNAMTIEAVAHLVAADVVYSYPSTESHLNLLQLLNQNVINIHETLYVRGRPFEDAYAEIIKDVFNVVKTGKRVVYATQGSPAFHCGTAVAIHRLAKREGYKSRLIAGISSFELISTELSESHDLKNIQLYNIPDITSGVLTLNPRAPALLFDLGRYVLPAVRENFTNLQTDKLSSLGQLLRSVYCPDHSISLILITPNGQTLLETVTLEFFETSIMNFGDLPTLFVGALMAM